MGSLKGRIKGNKNIAGKIKAIDFYRWHPSEKEIKRWLLDVCTHSLAVEYFCERFQVGAGDPQRPHDIIGKGNKFSWEVIKGLALQYRHPAMKTSSNFFRHHVQPALDLHRNYQYHHQMWNQPNPKATADCMKFGAIDAVCSLLENRVYQGGLHTYKEILELAKSDPPFQRSWMLEMVPEMRKIKQPVFTEIAEINEKSLTIFPNPGVSLETYNIIRERLYETRQMLRTEYGYKLK